MTDLGERSDHLARNGATLEGAPERSGLGARPPSRATRVSTIGLALILAIGGFAVVLRAFRDDEARTPTQDSIGPKANGVIWFRVGGGDGPSFIYEIQPDGSGERLVFGSETEPLRYSQVAWSPDGARIAYVDPPAASRSIYVSDPDGSDPQRLTDGANDRGRRGLPMAPRSPSPALGMTRALGRARRPGIRISDVRRTST